MVDQEEKEGRRGFKVEDRRRFSDSGEARPDAPPDAAAPRHTPTAAPPRHASTEAPPQTTREDTPPIEINFSTFVISLSTQALVHLGEIADPVSNNRMADLGAARQLIDILGIIKDKTKGNLDNSESALLDNILYDLRLRYVERARGQS